MEQVIYKKGLSTSQEASRCLLCYNAPCSESCPKGFDPAGMISSVRFENEKCASDKIDIDVCAKCEAPCEKACVHYDFPIRIKEMAMKLPPKKAKSKVDLSIDFCGVHCENPFFLSSSIVASNYEMCADALMKGWAGVVFKTIGFIRPEEVSPRFDAIKKDSMPFVGFKNLEQIAEHPLEENLAYLKKLKQDFPNKVIIASILGETEEEWEELARLVTEAGCDMIECNFSCPNMAKEGLGSDVGQDPELVKNFVQSVKRGTHLPVLAKMTPNTENIVIQAKAAVDGGAKSIAAINTIKSITGVNLDNISAMPDVKGKSAVSGYSGKAVKPIALRFISDIAKDKSLQNIPISGMGGIETWRDALEFILLGCSNIQITTSVMQYGYRIIDDLISGLSSFMYENGYKSVSDLVGKSLESIVSPSELDRKTIVFPKINKESCVGCGRCYISCADAGHQAITFDLKARNPFIHGDKCAGCHLCLLVCPTGSITAAKRINKINK